MPAALRGEPRLRPVNERSKNNLNLNEWKVTQRCQATVQGTLDPASLEFAEMTSYMWSILPARGRNGCSELRGCALAGKCCKKNE